MPPLSVRLLFIDSIARQADIDCTSASGLQSTLLKACRITRLFVFCLRQLTGKSGSFAITCRSLAERVAYFQEACFRLRSPSGRLAF